MFLHALLTRTCFHSQLSHLRLLFSIWLRGYLLSSINAWTRLVGGGRLPRGVSSLYSHCLKIMLPRYVPQKGRQSQPCVSVIEIANKVKAYKQYNLPYVVHLREILCCCDCEALYYVVGANKRVEEGQPFTCYFCKYAADTDCIRPGPVVDFSRNATDLVCYEDLLSPT